MIIRPCDVNILQSNYLGLHYTITGKGLDYWIEASDETVIIRDLTQDFKEVTRFDKGSRTDESLLLNIVALLGLNPHDRDILRYTQPNGTILYLF